MVEQGIWHTSLHEAIHACLAYAHKWEVIDLRCDAPREGVCHTVLPFWPLELPGKFRAAPWQTRKELAQTVSVLIAPSLVLRVPHSAGDEGDLCMWQHVWDRCRWGSYHGDEWATLYGEAQDAVHTWLQKPGTQACIERVAEALAQHRFLSAEAFTALLHPTPPTRPVAAVKPSTPAPVRARVPAPARRPPAPAPVAAQVAPRRAAPQPQAQPQEHQLSWEHLAWAYSQFFGHGHGVAPLSPYTPRLMRGSGRLLMS